MCAKGLAAGALATCALLGVVYALSYNRAGKRQRWIRISTALRRPAKEKVPFSPLGGQYAGLPVGRQSVPRPTKP